MQRENRTNQKGKDILAEIESRMRDVQQKVKNKARLEGEMGQVFTTLEHEFKVKTIEEAQLLLDSIMASEAKLRTSLANKERELRKMLDL